MNEKENTASFKVVMMGNSGVGKTSIVLRLSEHVFKEITRPTVGSGCITHREETTNGQVTLVIWDTAGEERYRSIASLYSQGAEAFVVVFDVTDEASFRAVPEWIETFKHTSDEKALIYVVGNKIDKDGREISNEKASEWCEANKYPYYEVSAMTGERVDLVFADLAEKLSEKQITTVTSISTIDRRDVQTESSCC